jgi:hypothetical protein
VTKRPNTLHVTPGPALDFPLSPVARICTHAREKRRYQPNRQVCVFNTWTSTARDEAKNFFFLLLLHSNWQKQEGVFIHVHVHLSAHTSSRAGQALSSSLMSIFCQGASYMPFLRSTF